MKLKTFSTEETRRLMEDLDRYWEMCALITVEARSRIEQGFVAHQRDFKWTWRSIFHSQIKTLDVMVYKMTGGQFRSTYYPFLQEKGYTEYLSSWLSDSDPAYMFEQEAYNTLILNAARIGNWKQIDIMNFHELVEKYAEHPLVPEADDIEIIKTVQTRLIHLEQAWDEYQDAL